MTLLVKTLLIFLIVSMSQTAYSQEWWQTDRSSSKVAPLPEEHPEAIVQVYAARLFRTRGYFAVHSWIATKEKNASTYKTYNVIGFRLERTGEVVVIEEDLPDRKWYGADPILVTELTGETAEAAIPKIHQAALGYPYNGEYHAWPGPNSNTFVSFIMRRVPELSVELPPHAIGRDWRGWNVLGLSETGTGVQFSLFGILGLTLGLGDGIEVNLLGLTFGLDVLRPALKLPLVGRVGMRDAPVF